MVETGGLEIRYGLAVIGGSNPSPSATFMSSSFLTLPLYFYCSFICNDKISFKSNLVPYRSIDSNQHFGV